MIKTSLAAGMALLVLGGCANSASGDPEAATGTATPQSQTTTTEQQPESNLHEKAIDEPGGWGCDEAGNPTAECVVTFTVTNIERAQCDYPEIHNIQPDNHLIRVDLDISTTQKLAEDQSNRLATLFLNQWNAVTSDGYTRTNLPEKPGCVAGIEPTDILLPNTKTRPTAIIEVPDDATELQLRPSGMERGGGWSWSLRDVS